STSFAEAIVADWGWHDNGTSCGIERQGFIEVKDNSANGNDKKFDFNINLPVGITISSCWDASGSGAIQQVNCSGNKIKGRIKNDVINATLDFELTASNSSQNNFDSYLYNIGGNTSANNWSSFCDDFGDAPASYGNSRHTYNNESITMWFGSTKPDYEGEQQYSDLADQDDLTGSDDESGINLQPWQAGLSCTGLTQDLSSGALSSHTIIMDASTYCITIPVTNESDTDALAAAWLDWNNNGQFDNTELARIATGFANVNAGETNSLVFYWDDITAAQLNSYIRLRITNQSQFINSPNPTTTYELGEAEDHFFERADYGDAPDTSIGTSPNNYQTINSDSGAKHLASFVNNVYLGSQKPDFDSGILQSISASADNNNDVNDEDGLVSAPPLSLSSDSYQLTVICNDYDSGNGGDQNAVVYGWVDANVDGVFDSTERASAECIDTSDNADGSASLSFSGLSMTTETATSYVRLRICSTNDCDTAIGRAENGEVEDYAMLISEVDYGDAPDDGGQQSYHTLASNLGASHILVDDIYLGNIAPDADEGIYQSIAADLDDDNENNDEDSITANLTFPSSRSTYTVNVICNDNNGTDLGATVHAWMDFNGDGYFAVDEYTYAACIDNSDTADGNARLTWIGISNVVAGDSYLRLRISTDTSVTDDTSTVWDERSSGLMLDGEVEDHSISFEQEYDFGDAPDSYLSLLASGGARHQLGANRYSLHLGSIAADSEDDAYQTPNNATGDDINDTSGIALGNDEDAVILLPGVFLDSTSYSVTLICNAHDESTAIDAQVYGWVDFNDNGQFDVNNNEFAQATCIDSSFAVDGSATLNFSGFTVATSPAISFARFRTTTDTLTDADFAGVASDGEVEDHRIIIGFRLSGTVFEDSGTDTSLGATSPFYNGVQNGTEAGIADVVITLYDETDGICYSAATDSNGEYEFAALGGHEYKLYETTNEVVPIPSVCPPAQGSINNDGLLVGNTIVDPQGYTSSSVNIIDLGVVNSDRPNNNFADFSAVEFAACAADGYLAVNGPADLYTVDLFTGNTTEIAPNITSTANGFANYNIHVGYLMQKNHLVGDVRTNNNRIIALVDGSYNVHLLPIQLNNGNLTSFDFHNAAITNDGILYLMSSGNFMLLIDVNPTSENYLQEVGRPTLNSGWGTADIAINPVNNIMYGMRRDGRLRRFNTATMTELSTRRVNRVQHNNNTRNYNTNHFSSGYGALYFDKVGNLYAVNNGRYSPPNPDVQAPVLQIPIGNDTQTNYTATVFSSLGFTMGLNDGARCRYAPLGLDYGDAPDSYQTLDASGGPFHITRNNPVSIGDLIADNDVDGQPNDTASGDDNGGTTPDDEDGFDNQIRVFVNSGNSTLTVPVNNTGNNNATLYAWLDINQNNIFDADERASVNVPANSNQAVTLNWTGFTNVVEGNSFARFRICTNNASLGCSTVGGQSSNGEVEDHSIKIIEGVFPNLTCDGAFVTNSNNATNYNFQQILTHSLPYDTSSITTNLTGMPQLNATAWDPSAGVFYGSFIDSDNRLHIATFDSQGNFVDLGLPVASENFSYIEVDSGNSTLVQSGQIVTAPTYNVGDESKLAEMGTISEDGQYYYIGHPNIAQILVVNLNDFTINKVNLRLPDIGLVVGSGATLPFDSDWAYDSDLKQLWTTDLKARTLYRIDPTTGGITTNALDFITTIPQSSSFGMIMGQDNDFLYLYANGMYDSDYNGSLDTDGDALFQVNVNSNKTLLLGGINNLNSEHADVAGCMVSPARDYGDAPSSFGTVSHFFTPNALGEVEYYLGQLWDSELSQFSSSDATSDNLISLVDEDGVVFPGALSAGNNTIKLTASQNGVVNLWLDYQNGGAFTSDEQLLTNYSVVAGEQDIIINLDSSKLGSYSGISNVRIRYCEQDSQCDQFNDSEQGNSAVNGEVEDYQIWVSATAISALTCQTNIIIDQSGTDFNLYKLRPDSLPFAIDTLQSPVTIATLTSFSHFSALGQHPINHLIYGTVVDTSTTDGLLKLVMTDQSGSNIVDLGQLYSAEIQQFNHAIMGSIDLAENQGFATIIGGTDIGAATSATIDPSGDYLYLHNQNWHDFLQVDLMTHQFKVISFSSPLSAMGGDIAFGADGLIYSVDLLNNQLFSLSPLTGQINSENLDWLGSLSSSSQSVGLFSDTGAFLYVTSADGNHDLDGDGVAEYTGSAMYKVNVYNRHIVAVGAMAQVYSNAADSAGCFVSADYGDTAFDTDGAASHYYFDENKDGFADFYLGNAIDTELVTANSTDATGDNLRQLNDEQGVSLPNSITVNSLTYVDAEVTGDVGVRYKLNVWVDLNGNGSYQDAGEQVLNEYDVDTGPNSIPLLLPAGPTSGYNGDTTIRFRLCQLANQCNKPDDEKLGDIAPNGEVEDYQFELINQILLKGYVFEDNSPTAGQAHNGIKDTDELGIGAMLVQVLYQGSTHPDYSLGDLIAATTTAANGEYSITVPLALADDDVDLIVVPQAKWIDISETSAAIFPQVTSTSVTDATLSIRAAAGVILTGLNFGKVQAPTMEPDHFTEAEPGSVIDYPHRFNAYTTGTVDLRIENRVAAPVNDDWIANIFADDNCNGVIDAGDEAISAIINVDKNNGEICIISNINIPSNATINSQYSFQIVADMDFDDPDLTGHGITRQATNNDGVRASFAGAGSLKLSKTVENITQATGVGVVNMGQPGDILEYVITFENLGSGAITQVELFDATPEYTELANIVDCSDTLLPSGVGCMIETGDGNNEVGYQGKIRWVLSGAVIAGASGKLAYRVKIL
uniref:GEVED domain-containing protein n=1 Tax=Shewanella marina TaxID=487319 RepID=UPI000472B9BE